MSTRPIVIRGGQVLTADGLAEADVGIDDGVIAGIASAETAAPDGEQVIDARGLFVLPGIVDIHGDAFERQIMPRPKVTFPLDVALHETDRQIVANGITTAFHGLTVSWEPGLRSLEAGTAFVSALAATRPHLTADTRLHIRWETFALDAVDLVESWLGLDFPPVFAFNDHTTGSFKRRTDPVKLRSWAERSGVTEAEYRDLLDEVWARHDDVSPAIERLAAAARQRGVAMLSHDDASPDVRAGFRDIGCHVAEFPLTWETAETARAADEHVVLGAPNVVRGGSHIGAVVAADAAEAGVCTVLASDYYYPALLVAAFRLVAEGRLPLERAWPLVSANPAQAAGLVDRGEISPGKRADVIVVEARDGHPPRVRASVIDGKLAYLSETRLN
jgi:alpha-D-ribose 1-methylphosphonate 5-triphosphate diphosphatase